MRFSRYLDFVAAYRIRLISAIVGISVDSLIIAWPLEDVIPPSLSNMIFYMILFGLNLFYAWLIYGIDIYPRHWIKVIYHDWDGTDDIKHDYTVRVMEYAKHHHMTFVKNMKYPTYERTEFEMGFVYLDDLIQTKLACI